MSSALGATSCFLASDHRIRTRELQFGVDVLQGKPIHCRECEQPLPRKRC